MVNCILWVIIGFNWRLGIRCRSLRGAFGRGAILLTRVQHGIGNAQRKEGAMTRILIG